MTTITSLSFYRSFKPFPSFRLISLVFFSFLVVISCGDTTASGDEEEATGTVTNVTINGTAPYTVKIDGTPLELTATVAVEGGAAATTVTWSSADTKIATVDTSGKVTGVAVGNVDITATSTADATKSDKVTVTVEPPAPATAIMDTAVANANNVQRNYYFLVDVTTDSTDKLKLVVKETSEPVPTAAEIKAGAGQTKTLSPTAKTVMFVYPIDSKIGNYKGAAQGLYPHEVTKDVKDKDGNTLVVDTLADGSLNIDGMLLKPGTAYTIYATAPDDTGAVLTGGSYTPPAFDATKPMMDLDVTPNGGGGPFGVYDESLFASTLSYHVDDALFVLPMFFAKTTTDTGTLYYSLRSSSIQLNVDIDNPAYEVLISTWALFPSSYYDSTQTIPHLSTMGTGTSAQKASFAFFFIEDDVATWVVEYAYNTPDYVPMPNELTVTEEK